METCDSRLEISLLRSESTDIQLKKIATMIEGLSRDVTFLKERQNMLFRKQDLLQSTLAGEVRVHLSDTPHSMSTSSIVAWSPLPTSPPFIRQYPGGSYSQTPSHQQANPLSATENPSASRQLAGGTYCSPAPYAASIQSHDSYSIDDVQSFLSENWDGPRNDIGVPGFGFQQAGASTNVTPIPISVPPLIPSSTLPIGDPVVTPTDKGQISSTHSPVTSAPSVVQTKPPDGNPLANSTPPMTPFGLQDIQLSELNQLQCIALEGTSDSHASFVPTSGNPPRLSDDTLAPSEDNQVSQPNRALLTDPTGNPAATDDFFAQKFLSTRLIPSSTVFATFQLKIKGKEIELSNVGRLAVLLARCSYFGDDVLQVSTLRGKGNRRGLDPHKLKSLLTEVHRKAFPLLTQEDFMAKVQTKIEQALRDYLKPSRAVKKSVSPGNPSETASESV